MAANDAPTCSRGCTGCEGDVEEPTPGSKLCKKCVCDFIRALDNPPQPACEPVHLLAARDLKLVVLKEDGDPISDWAPIKSHALARIGYWRSGQLLPKVPEDVDEAFKYPNDKGEEQKRSYANACHVHTYAAMVSYMKENKKKPRGDDVHPFLNATWGKYKHMSETVRALTPVASPARARTDARVPSQVELEDGEDDEVPEQVYASRYGDTISIGTTNSYKLADFKNATNHTKLEKEVKKARTLMQKFEEDSALTTKHGYLARATAVSDGATVDETEAWVRFRCKTLSKKKATVWSLSEYEVPARTTARGGGRGGAPPSRSMQVIALTIDRDVWQEAVKKFDAMHDVNPSMVGFSDGEVEGDRKKRDGERQWTETMIDLQNMELYFLGQNEARTESTDPKETLRSKLKEMEADRAAKAEAIFERKERERVRIEAKEKEAAEMKRKAAEAWAAHAASRRDMLENDDVKVAAISQVSKSVYRMERKVGGLTVPKGVSLPTLSDWLEANDLGHLKTPLQGWRLKTMLRTCNDATFETDFGVIPGVDRRNLQVALRDTLEELQPPTPSPPTMKRPRPHASASHTPGRANHGQMPSYAPSELGDWDDVEPDDLHDEGCTASVYGGSSAPSDASSTHTARQSTSSSARLAAAGIARRRPCSFTAEW